MQQTIDAIRDWLNQQPLWLQDAARRVVASSPLTETDTSELAELCKRESDILPSPTFQELEPLPLDTDVFRASETDKEISILELKNLQGINKLSPQKPLEFGEKGLTVVYGANGAGKSGYVKLIKHIAGAKDKEELLPNVYNATPPPRQGCDIKIKEDGCDRELSWCASNGVHLDLSCIDVFDASCGDVYNDKENEVVYEPKALKLFTNLVNACSLIKNKLELEHVSYPSQKAILPAEYSTTTIGAWYQSISHTTQSIDIDKNTAWCEEDDASKADLEKRLSQKDPQKEHTIWSQHLANLDFLITQVESYQKQYSDERCRHFIHLHSQYIQKHKASDEASKKVFDGASLQGVGTDTWKELWLSAQRYSEQFAYPTTPFPVTDGVCPLCHQDLSSEAKQRFLNFDQFIKGDLVSQAQAALNEFNAFTQTFSQAYQPEHWGPLIDAAGITEPGFKKSLIELNESIRLRSENLFSHAKIEEIHITDFETSLSALRDYRTRMDSYVKVVLEDIKGQNRPLLTKQLLELKAKQWCSINKDTVVKEVARLGYMAALAAAIRSANSSGISREKTKLSEILITERFCRQFSQELESLGGRNIKAKLVKSRTSQGKLLHKIQITDSHSVQKIGSIFSEGEQKITSLAAFIADIGMRSGVSPVVYDDPVTSLDQEYESNVINRIVEQAQERQVIVFTHKLSLASQLCDTAKINNLESKCIGLSYFPNYTGEPGSPPMSAQKATAALNTLKNQRIPQAKNVLEAGDVDAHNILMRAICGDLRVCTERIVEDVLINGTVQRFRRSITTLNKLDKLAKINIDDCRLIESFMTKYSFPEHSQPYEAPVQLPDVAEVEADLTTLVEWANEFKDRSLPDT